MHLPILLRLIPLLFFFHFPQIKSDDNHANCLFPSTPIGQKLWQKSEEGNKLEFARQMPQNSILLRGILLPPQDSLSPLLMGELIYEVEIGHTSEWPKRSLDAGEEEDQDLDNPNGIAFLITAKTNKYGGFALEMPVEYLEKYRLSMFIRFNLPGDASISSSHAHLSLSGNGLHIYTFNFIKTYIGAGQLLIENMNAGTSLLLNDECRQIESLKNEGGSGIWVKKVLTALNNLKKEQEKLKEKIDKNFREEKKEIEKKLGTIQTMIIGEQKGEMDSLKNEHLKPIFDEIIGKLTKLEENFGTGKAPKKRGIFGIGSGSRE